jgi:glycerol-3-phosphate dehydrogenase (NAD(P)+)
VALGRPTALVIASADEHLALDLQRTLAAPAFRLYTNHDVIGVEIAAALKNVMAIATGLADGLALGENARAALITRGLAEIARLGVALGAQPATFLGLAGLGDLVLTCTGSLTATVPSGSRSPAAGRSAMWNAGRR